jgi:hypothetical protein
MSSVDRMQFKWVGPFFYNRNNVEINTISFHFRTALQN